MNKKKIKRKSKIWILGIFFIILVVILFLCISHLFGNSKQFDLENMKKDFLKEYTELREYDQYDISSYFGIPFTEEDQYLFMGDFTDDPENPGPFSPKELIAVINVKDPSDYYEVLKGFVDTNSINTEDSKIAKLFSKAIVKKGKNYTYLILGSKIKEKELLAYLK